MSAFGETREQALAEAEIALDLFLRTYQEEGTPIPDTQRVEHYSGQFRVRIPHTLHRRAAELAELEGVSLNQFILDCIAENVGFKRMHASAMEEIRRAIETVSSLSARHRF